jgi:hypothetical protein
MRHEIAKGTVLIKDDAVLPKGLHFESEPCVPGWKAVTDLDGYGLDRVIQKAGWTFFCLVGEVKSTVFGIDHQKMLRRAIERILASPKLEKFNSLEITRVASIGSERFPLVRYVTVSAQPRHVQESLFLFHAGELPQPGKKCEPAAIQSTGNAGDTPALSQERTKQSSGISIFSEVNGCLKESF